MSRIVYVEDNPDSVRLVSLILRSAAVEVLSAADGVAGLSLVRSTRPDLVLLDVDLPLLDGVELARRIRDDPDVGRTPIIAISAHVMNDERRRCLDAGCVAFIEKPFDIQQLLRLVRRHLGRDAQ